MEDGASKAASTYCDLQMTARTTPIASIILSFGVIMVDTADIWSVSGSSNCTRLDSVLITEIFFGAPGQVTRDVLRDLIHGAVSLTTADASGFES